MRIWGIAVVLALASRARAQPAPEATSAEEVTPAVRAFQDGRALLEDKKPGEACAKFEASIALDPAAPGTMLNLGLCNEILGRTATALHWFRKAQFRSAESGMTEYEAAAKDKTALLAQRVAVVEVVLANPAPSGATFSLDGHQIDERDLRHLEVDPSSHTLEMRVRGKPPVRAEFSIADGERAQVQLAVPAPRAPAPPRRDHDAARTRAILLGGLGLGLYAGTAALSLTGRRIYRESDHPDTWDRWKAIVRYGGTTMFLAGTAAVAGGVYLYVRAPDERRAAQMAVTPVIGPSELGVAVHGGF